MEVRKLDEIAASIDDASTMVEELQGDASADVNEKLEVLHQRLDDASDAIDELEDTDQSEPLLNTMTMDLEGVRQIALDVLREHAPELEVLGVTSGEGGSDYAELFIGIRGCRAEPCRLSLGVDRSATPSALRAALIAKLNDHLREHRTADQPI